MDMREKVDALTKALEFYADRSGDGYEVCITDYGGWTGLDIEKGIIIYDAGEKAVLF